jgi:hypothetical protein
LCTTAANLREFEHIWEVLQPTDLPMKTGVASCAQTFFANETLYQLSYTPVFRRTKISTPGQFFIKRKAVLHSADQIVKRIEAPDLFRPSRSLAILNSTNQNPENYEKQN